MTSATRPLDREAPSRLHPITGWSLKHFGSLDEASPGFLWAAMQASSLWKNACRLAFAHGLHADAGVADPVHFAVTLRASKPDDIILEALGTLPVGLMGALARVGPDGLCSEESYRRLAAIHSNPASPDRRKAAVLRHLQVIDDEVIAVVDTVRADLLSPTIVSSIPNRTFAAHLNALAAAIEAHCTHASGRAIRRSLEASTPGRRLDDWARGWLERADVFPTPPFSGDDDVRPLSPADLRRAGRRFRNCLGTKLGYLLSGQLAFFECVPERAIAVTVKLSDGWLLTRIHGVGNCRVPEGVQALIRAKFRRRGVRTLEPEKPQTASAPVAMLFDGWGGGLIDLEDFGDS